MIDPNNDSQVSWLKAMNQEIGNLVTSNIALMVERDTLAQRNAALENILRDQQQQIQAMGQTNAELRERIIVLRGHADPEPDDLTNAQE